MSKEDKIINSLFDQARNEKLETSASDIQKWIGYVTLGTIIAGLLTKIKLLITKSAIMYSSVILALGIGIGSYFIYGKEGSQPKAPSDKSNKSYSTEKEIKLENEILPLDSDQLANHPKTTRQNDVIVENNEDEKLFEPTSFPFNLPIQQPPFLSELPKSISVNNNSDETNYGPFSALNIYGAVEVVISQGEKESVRIEGDEVGKSILVIKNNKKTLEVYTENKKNLKISSFKLIVYITINNLTEIECSGASDLKSTGELNFDNIKLSFSGASDINLTLNAQTIDLSISGASDAKLNIKAQKIKADVYGASDVVLAGSVPLLELISSGASDVKAEKLDVQDGNISCLGASVTKVRVSDNINIDVSGASDLTIKGNPKIGTKSVTGASKVRQF